MRAADTRSSAIDQKVDGGVYAVLPPGRLVPTETRVFVEVISAAIMILVSVFATFNGARYTRIGLTISPVSCDRWNFFLIS